MPIYTGTGDGGDTGLFGNRRVSKHDARIEAYGTIDELNAFLGLLRTEDPTSQRHAGLKSIQDALFEIGADLATEGGRASLSRIVPATTELERWIDESEAQLPQLGTFVLPGGSRPAALMHVLRTITRRAERRYWALRHNGVEVPAEIGIYLNRLSDLFFTWARLSNQEAGIADVPWSKQGPPESVPFQGKPGRASTDPGP